MEPEGNIEFRKALLKDIASIKALVQKLYLHDNINYNESQVSATLEELITDEESGSVWLIIFNNNIAGYLILINTFSVEFGGRVLFIDELFIDEKSRGNGLGKSAIAFAEEYALEKGIKAVRLEVELSNKIAHDVYLRSGFTEHERYIMTKRVNKN